MLDTSAETASGSGVVWSQGGRRDYLRTLVRTSPLLGWKTTAELSPWAHGETVLNDTNASYNTGPDFGLGRSYISLI